MVRTALAVIGTLGAFGFLGAVDYSEALIQEAAEKEARPKRVVAQDQALPFAFPIDYRAIVCQRSHYGERATCRYYAERTK